MSGSPKVDTRTGAIRRQRRNQGFTDGRCGRATPRYPDDVEYMHSFGRGLEARAEEAEDNGRAEA